MIHLALTFVAGWVILFTVFALGLATAAAWRVVVIGAIVLAIIGWHVGAVPSFIGVAASGIGLGWLFLADYKH